MKCVENSQCRIYSRHKYNGAYPKICDPSNFEHNFEDIDEFTKVGCFLKINSNREKLFCMFGK